MTCRQHLILPKQIIGVNTTPLPVVTLPNDALFWTKENWQNSLGDFLNNKQRPDYQKLWFFLQEKAPFSGQELINLVDTLTELTDGQLLWTDLYYLGDLITLFWTGQISGNQSLKEKLLGKCSQDTAFVFLRVAANLLPKEELLNLWQAVISNDFNKEDTNRTNSNFLASSFEETVVPLLDETDKAAFWRFLIKQPLRPTIITAISRFVNVLGYLPPWDGQTAAFFQTTQSYYYFSQLLPLVQGTSCETIDQKQEEVVSPTLYLWGVSRFLQAGNHLKGETNSLAQILSSEKTGLWFSPQFQEKRQLILNELNAPERREFLLNLQLRLASSLSRFSPEQILDFYQKSPAPSSELICQTEEYLNRQDAAPHNYLKKIFMRECLQPTLTEKKQKAYWQNILTITTRCLFQENVGFHKKNFNQEIIRLASQFPSWSLFFQAHWQELPAFFQPDKLTFLGLAAQTKDERYLNLAKETPIKDFSVNNLLTLIIEDEKTMTFYLNELLTNDAGGELLTNLLQGQNETQTPYFKKIMAHRQLFLQPTQNENLWQLIQQRLGQLLPKQPLDVDFYRLFPLILTKKEISSFLEMLHQTPDYFNPILFDTLVTMRKRGRRS